MVVRPYWSGQLRLSLVTLPVNIYAALNAARQISLHEIYEPTGERVRRQKVVNNKPVDNDEIIKGYEYEKDEYVLLTQDEIDALKVPSKNTIDLVQFVKAEEIDPLYFEKPYFVAPDGDSAEEAFIVIRDALRAKKMVALGQLAIAGRERLCAIRACGSGMLLETLRYKEEIRKSDPYFADIDELDVADEQVELAKELIDRKTAKFDPSKFHDHYRDALQELIDAKIEKREVRELDTQKLPTGKVVNLMDALKKSLNAKNTSSAEKPSPKAKVKASTKKTPAKTKAKAKPKVTATKKTTPRKKAG
ncbi:MAG: Ku protein [Alphaproteobacteria bacterium]|nr:Ku protein [Alphaproteobacteria bacterium]